MANFVLFIGEGRGTPALADALQASEERRAELEAGLELLERGPEVFSGFRPLVFGS